MSSIATLPRTALFRIKGGEFWSGDLGLTLIRFHCAFLFSSSLRCAKPASRAESLVDLLMMVLMVFAAIAVKQTRFDTILVIVLVLVTAALLGSGARLSDAAACASLGAFFQPLSCSSTSALCCW